MAVVGYGIGNVGSIVNMLRKLRVSAQVVTDAHALASAKRVILPGIGAFDACMSLLDDSGLRGALMDFAHSGRPLLGICVGMQMLTSGSEEGRLPGLGLIEAHTRRLPDAQGLRIPHMGWDAVRWNQPEHPLARGLLEESRFYFVHSYCVLCDSPRNMLASCAYGIEFAAAICSGSIAGVQFHPEKSHRFGLQLLANFAQT
ncbi:MAG: imidazole glycerol phosphate synthase subunit HisH [Proteobacteria bacterium]|nr:imidazole glycerol phosphate synthase subunit HisH [Pseudomonadota bacterium]